MGSFLLFDIGGTKIRLSRSDDLKHFSETVLLETPQDFDQGFNLFIENAKKVLNGKDVEAGAGGIAAVLDKSKKEMVRSPHLPNWANKDFWVKAEKALGIPIYLENDSSIVGLGEASQIKDYKEKIIVYYSIGTGVGGSRIVKGEIDKNVYGFEPGHQIIDIDGSICPTCGIPSHLEGYVSGTGIERRYGKKVSEISDKRVWDEISAVLAAGIHNSIIHWSPDLVIIGGGIMEFLPINLIENNLRTQMQIFPKYPNLELAKLADIGGIYGALEYLKQIRAQ